MSGLLDEALEKVFVLPPEEQDAIASQILASLETSSGAWPRRRLKKTSAARQPSGSEPAPNPGSYGGDQWDRRLTEPRLKLHNSARLRLVGLLTFLRRIRHVDVNKLHARIPLSQQRLEGIFQLKLVDVDERTPAGGGGIELLQRARPYVPRAPCVSVNGTARAPNRTAPRR
jgi:hypothetical protein